MNYEELDRKAKLGDEQSIRMLEERAQKLEPLPIRDELGNRLTWCTADIPEGLLQSIDKMYGNISVTDIDTDISIEEESFHSSRIEGVDIPQEELFEVFKAKRTGAKGDKMVLNTYRAVKYLNVSQKRDIDTLVKLWNILTDGVSDGKGFRTTEATGPRRAPEVELLDYCMKQFFEFYHGDNVPSPYIKMAVLHFYFVYMYPFQDGNGRIARLISTDFLIRSGLENFSALTLSKTINETTERYYEAFDQSRNSLFDITPFIQYMLKTVYDNFYEVLEKQHENLGEHINWDEIFE